jgi:hypothetical protein
MRKRRIAHQANLNQVLLFRKKMSTLIAIGVGALRRHDEGSVQGGPPNDPPTAIAIRAKKVEKSTEKSRSTVARFGS